jgi:hypothetical protein
MLELLSHEKYGMSISFLWYTNYFCGTLFSMKKKRGRPKLPTGQVRETSVRVRVSPTERAKIEADARHDETSVSDWIRKKLL